MGFKAERQLCRRKIGGYRAAQPSSGGALQANMARASMFVPMHCHAHVQPPTQPAHFRCRWADKDYNKSHLGSEWKKPFAGASHSKGIVLEKM